MGDDGVCTGELVGTERAKHILSFGEDEDGELYILTTTFASSTRRQGVVYQIVDPARSAMHQYAVISLLSWQLKLITTVAHPMLVFSTVLSIVIGGSTTTFTQTNTDIIGLRYKVIFRKTEITSPYMYNQLQYLVI